MPPLPRISLPVSMCWQVCHDQQLSSNKMAAFVWVYVRGSVHQCACCCSDAPSLDGCTLNIYAQSQNLAGREQKPEGAEAKREVMRVLWGVAGATITGGTMTVEGCGSESLQGDVRFAEVMGLMGAQVQWAPYSITITGAPLSRITPSSSVPSIAIEVGQYWCSGRSVLQSSLQMRV